jgi:hypothetical protein
VGNEAVIIWREGIPILPVPRAMVSDFMDVWNDGMGPQIWNLRGSVTQSPAYDLALLGWDFEGIDINRALLIMEDTRGGGRRQSYSRSRPWRPIGLRC